LPLVELSLVTFVAKWLLAVIYKYHYKPEHTNTHTLSHIHSHTPFSLFLICSAVGCHNNTGRLGLFVLYLLISSFTALLKPENETITLNNINTTSHKSQPQHTLIKILEKGLFFCHQAQYASLDNFVALSTSI